jgi:hypothetical protein
MNIGFVNIYPWRPHGFHGAYLARLCDMAGHSVFILECPGRLDSCYSKLIQGGNLSRCVKCKLGSLSTYGIGKVSKISSKHRNDKIPEETITEGLLSSSVTLYREEVESIYLTSDRLIEARDKLKKNYEDTYHSTLEMISKNNLHCLIVFNGRIDMTRAAIEAAKDSRINFVTHERSYMGHGIQLNVNENCLGLRSRTLLNQKFDLLPLTKTQAALAGSEIAKRFMGTNHLEWRVYNKGSKQLDEWPTVTHREKILVIPSSRSEVGGHQDWANSCGSNVDALSLFLNKIGAEKDQVVVRFHPNWAQNVGKSDGKSSRRLYKEWCDSEGYFYIDSHESVSTMGLLAQCDVAVLNGGSAAIEAAALGKKVVNLGAAPYKGASFCCFLSTPDEIEKFTGFDNWISDKCIFQSVLRYVYIALARFPQYCQFVRASETTSYKAYLGANVTRLENIISNGEIIADDEDFADSDVEEIQTIELLKLRDWPTLTASANKFVEADESLLSIKKKPLYGYIDKIRPMLQRGDL